MYHHKVCAYCSSQFEAVRSDANYCSALCRTKASQHRKLVADFEKERAKKMEEIQEEIREIEIKEAREAEKDKLIEVEYQKMKESRSQLLKILALDFQRLMKVYQKHELKHYPNKMDFRYVIIREIDDYYKDPDTRQTVIDLVTNFKEKLQAQVKKLEKEMMDLCQGGDSLLKASLYFRKNTLKTQLKKLENQEPPQPEKPTVSETVKSFNQRKRKPIRRSFVSRNPNNDSKEVEKFNKEDLSAEDVLHMTFDTYMLSGELGRFLGELDHNKVAFALTGDSGAGKSYFSFELARLFLDEGKTVKYYSLEEGIGKLTQEKLIKYDIGDEMKITDYADLKKIRKDASKFNVLIIDSYSKIATDPKDFENLRQSFPKTLFIIIFQKTTGKTMRGGSSIKYNSSATINVCFHEDERVAIMVKGRYGTQGWIYSIERGQIIKEH